LNKLSKRMIQDLVISELKERRSDQDKKWGKGAIDYHSVPRILGEEYGEVCRALNEKDMENFHQEVLDVAAFSMAILEQLVKEEYEKKEDPFTT
jgi:NTP pyrophosphatase (non-canonical NTP hydrolase)